MSPAPADPALGAESAAEIAGRLLAGDRRVLLTGAPGTGKSTLAAGLARTLAAAGRPCACISADPGSPAFGIPGTVSLGQWSDGAWHLQARQALCTLDGGRFRLPLVEAVRRLARDLPAGTVLVDGPGVVRGVAGAELMQALVAAAGADLVLGLTRDGTLPPGMATAVAGAAQIRPVRASPAARRPGKRVRERRRTARWDEYLQGAAEQELDLARVVLTGTPPPTTAPEAWPGRQVARVGGGQTLGLGEVLALEGTRLRVRMTGALEAPEVLLVRDARRDPSGVLATAPSFAGERLHLLASPEPARRGGAPSPPLAGRVGAVDVTLVNGVLGDPLLHLRLRHRRRSLLFDLGEGLRLSARTAHQVTDVFITHAHMDHIGGFLWLLRSRIAELPACRLYGPPGLAAQVDALVRGILWDRVGERAPRFRVDELHGETVHRFRVQAGRPGAEPVGREPAPDGLLRAEPAFRVRAVTLDHGTPVLAFAFEPARQLNVRKDRLAARGLAPGPWLGALKARLAAGEGGTVLTLPDGSRETVDALAAELLLVTPGRRLVYATDLADTPANRTRLTGLARGAHTLFCEAAFTQAEAAQARRTGHLTARACGEIADAAGVGRLVPFHFSRRYAEDLSGVYEEVSAACPRAVVPAAHEAGQPVTGRGLGAQN